MGDRPSSSSSANRCSQSMLAASCDILREIRGEILKLLARVELVAAWEAAKIEKLRARETCRVSTEL